MVFCFFKTRFIVGNVSISRWCWHTPLIPVLGRQREADPEFKASLAYRASSKTEKATQRNPVSKSGSGG